MSDDNNESKKKTKNQEKRENLEDEFSRLQSSHTLSSSDIDKYLVDPSEDLPGFGQVEVYDYDNDINEVQKVSENVIENLVDLYLGDSPDIKTHPYIQQKQKEDTFDYADTKFLNKMSRKLLLQQLRQIDNGDNSARMYEVANQTMKEIRENIKESRSSRSEIEKFYKDIRIDMGLNDMATSNSSVTTNDGEEEAVIIDTKQLNNTIDEYLKNKS